MLCVQYYQGKKSVVIAHRVELKPSSGHLFLNQVFVFAKKMAWICITPAIARSRRNQSENLKTSLIASIFALVETFSCFARALACRSHRRVLM